MQVLVATAESQGRRTDDFDWCVEGATAPVAAIIFEAFTPTMDATGQWDVEVPTPLGRLHFDVYIRADGAATASYRGHPVRVPAMQTSPEGEGLRVRWTQRLTFPVRVDIGLDALVVGDRLTGVATAGSLMRPARLEGHRVA